MPADIKVSYEMDQSPIVRRAIDDLFLEAGSYNFTTQSEDDHYESVFFTIQRCTASQSQT